MGVLNVSKHEKLMRELGFEDGVRSERERLISYLVGNGIIRRDAFGVWVRETMGDQVTDLPDLEPDELPAVSEGEIMVAASEIGAMMVRNNRAYDEALKGRLLKLREITPAGSEVSLAITRWVVEIV